MNVTVRLQEPIGPHVPLRIGGICDAFVVAHDEEAVATVLADCKEAGWSVHVLGCGTRTVFRDLGFDGLVLQLGTGFRSVEVEGTRVTAGGAVPVPAVLACAAAAGLAPTRELFAVPGSFGASVVHELWEVVSARLARPAKRESSRIREVDELGPRTRGVVLQATVELEAVGEREAERRFRKALRRAIVPPGSWVRDNRPVRDVLRRASLERVRLRNVAIPEEAPELLVNLGGGTAEDLKLLHKSSMERVKRIRGLDLDATVKWVGRTG